MGKLRNKKTGEIVDLSIFGITLNIRKEEQPTYHSIEGVCEDWEDVEEPLIKDEKICKAIRAWAEANKFSVFIVDIKRDNVFEIRGLTEMGDIHGCSIYFKGAISKPNNITYTIAELCGEEEE